MKTLLTYLFWIIAMIIACWICFNLLKFVYLIAGEAGIIIIIIGTIIGTTIAAVITLGEEHK